jgi:hypothetical protein
MNDAFDICALLVLRSLQAAPIAPNPPEIPRPPSQRPRETRPEPRVDTPTPATPGLHTALRQRLRARRRRRSLVPPIEPSALCAS